MYSSVDIFEDSNSCQATYLFMAHILALSAKKPPFYIGCVDRGDDIVCNSMLAALPL